MLAMRASTLQRSSIAAVAIVSAVVSLTAFGSQGRSQAVVAKFRAANVCPATGLRSGSCPGWQVDHVTPLRCGGTDTPANMQWLTVEQHKVKTAREAKVRCRPERPNPQE